MSRYDEVRTLRFRNLLSALTIPVICLLLSAPAFALDLVILTDGSEFEGRVISLDLNRLVLETVDGKQRKFRRDELAAIDFSPEPAVEPIRVAVRVLGEDDEVQLFLDDRPIGTPGQLTSEWVDISDMLAEGGNRIRGEVSNKVGLWAYRWVLEASGERYTFACGLPRKSGCTAQGASGKERGEMPAGAAWIYVHRVDGTVEVEQD